MSPLVLSASPPPHGLATAFAGPLPVLRLQHDGVVLVSNEAAQSLLMPFGSVLGLNLFRLFPECAEMALKLKEDRTSHLQQLLSWRLPSTLDSPKVHDILAFLSPTSPATPKLAAHDWQLILVDLTHWLAYWRHDVAQQARQAQQLNLREWAHEINNPLGGLLAATQWWQKSTLPKLPSPLQEDTAPIIEMLLLEINRLRERMRRTLSPPETAQSQTAINVHQPLEQALQLFMHEFPEVRILKDYDVSAPEVWVHPESLQQIFDNLLRNAGQAMRRAERSNPTLRLRSHVLFSVLLHGKNQRMALSLDIEDNGTGMQEGNRDAMPMHPAPAKGQAPAQGHGLGLGIVRKLVEEQEAEMRLMSEVGKTKWTLILPCAA